MSMNMDNVVSAYRNQVVVTLHSTLDPDTLRQDVVSHWSPYEQMLKNHLQHKDTTSRLQLVRFNMDDILHVQDEQQPIAGSLPSGVFLFETSTDLGLKGSIVTFYNIESGIPSTMDYTPAVIDQLLTLKDTIELNKQHISALAVERNWLMTGVEEVGHGCPITPPISVQEPPSSGRWTVNLPQLPAAFQGGTGKGVTVFVLDAFPQPQQIRAAATGAGSNNMLLQDMATGMVSESPYNTAVPPAINLKYLTTVSEPSENVVTGKDIYGNLIGFPMADHGLFVAGLVRDVAPEASIECIRVLDDFCTASVATLISSLSNINNRMSTAGDLYQKQVVINLSLVVMPPDDQNPPREGLLTPMQSLTEKGAIFVASTGNDSDPRDTSMNNGQRMGPRYPANFAYDSDHPTLAAKVIPVGAVNSTGSAASYSNYPGEVGVATYAGEVPTPDPSSPPSDGNPLA